MSSAAELRTYSRKDSIVFRKTSERFGGLSNMASGFPLEVNGIRILTSEALYQACRFPHRPEVQRLIIHQGSPMTAKMKSKPHRKDTRSDWDKVRVNIMRWCLRVKLTQNRRKFSELLLATGDRHIVEGSRKDDFWGAKSADEETLVGRNVLGRLLMELRDELRGSKEALLKGVEPPSVSQFLLYGKPIGTVEACVGARTDSEFFGESIPVGAEHDGTSPPISGPNSLVPAGEPKEVQPQSKAREEARGDGVIPKECKRLAEVDFPIAEVSRHAAKEKEARCGHIPKIHIWPAARPIASSRAVLLGLLWPDPCDPLCPSGFKQSARELLPRLQGTVGPADEDLRKALLKFIADFANWDNSAQRTYLEVSRALVKAAHGDEPPLVVDPFAGGGSIPLEALRLGCEAFASDLNPVACLILKVVLEDVPRHGPKLADELRRLGDEIKREVEKDLVDLYPKDSDGATPITYLWARTVLCESPNCGAEIPLMRSLWLCKKARRKLALRHRVVQGKGTTPRVEFEIFEPKAEKDVAGGTVTRAKATCVCCGAVLPPDRVRAQLAVQHGGADAVFDAKGQRTGGARLLAVVLLKPGETGRRYRLATEDDYAVVSTAMRVLQQHDTEWRAEKTMSFVPDEAISLNELRRISVPLYGMQRWGDLFTTRQRLVLGKIASLIAKQHNTSYATRFLALNFSKMVDMNNALATWQPHAEIPAHMFTRNAIPMKWDFAEAVPLSESSGTLQSAIKRSTEPLSVLSVIDSAGSVQRMDAGASTLPDQTAAVWFTDPPYYDAVPYSYLSDFFYVWLRRALAGEPRELFSSSDVLKDAEIVVDRPHSASASKKDVAFYEAGMARAFAEGRRGLNDNGIGCVVFAHKTTEGWEALLSGMIRGGWTITASWPVATEMGSRLNARETASLATSVHLVCRPRPDDAGVGDWADVLRELPTRVGDWMERLQGEGVRGADLVFACIGPALEIFSRYPKVETAEGREVALAKYLEKVWEVVGRSALEQVLGTAEAKARNGAGGAVEEDARLTALFLWTLQSTDGETDDENDEGDDEEPPDEDDEEGSTRGKAKGFTLVFDVVRRFAQPLGIDLPKWEGRVIETKKGVVRLLPIAERAKQLFGEDGAQAVAARLEQGVVLGTNPLQGMLFPDLAAAPKSRGPGRGRGTLGGIEVSDESLAAAREATTLDRVHAAMLLQAGGRTNALRALLKAEQERGPDFLRLANAFSALYPKGSEEKRLVDAMLLAVPR